MKIPANKAAGCSSKQQAVSIIRFTVCCYLFLLTIATYAQSIEPTPAKRCGTVEYENYLQQQNPLRRQQVNALHQRIQQFATQQAQARQAQALDETIYRIPVVVHIIHNNSSNFIGGNNNPNISDAQIQDQIAVLNEDYRRVPGTRGYNTSTVGADARIEFFLAQTDPQGQTTTGITRHYYNQSEFNVFGDWNLVSNIAYWPSGRYLNIWVVPKLNNDYLGFAKYPSAADTLKGLSIDSDERTDGLLISSLVFGRVCPTIYRYNCFGRTATHEIGHWLGLFHTWGDAYCGDDYVYDTPPTESDYKGTVCTETFSNCNGVRTRNLIENYMDYSPDNCMNMFTKGQVERMRAVLQLSPRRVQLIQSSTQPLPEAETLTLNLLPNPATTTVTAEVLLKGAAAFTIELVDMSGRLVQTKDYGKSISTRVSLSLSDLSAGIYIIRVKTDAETQSKRLMVY